MSRELRTPPSLREGWRIPVTAGVLALMVGCASEGAGPAAPDGRAGPDTPPKFLFGTTWFVEQIDAGDIIDGVGPLLVIRSVGHATGSGGCNSFSGSVTIKGDAITFGRSDNDGNGLHAGGNEPGTEILCRPRRDPLVSNPGPLLDALRCRWNFAGQVDRESPNVTYLFVFSAPLQTRSMLRAGHRRRLRIGRSRFVTHYNDTPVSGTKPTQQSAAGLVWRCAVGGRPRGR
jgi:hypothetical protein